MFELKKRISSGELHVQQAIPLEEAEQEKLIPLAEIKMNQKGKQIHRQNSTQ